MVYKDDPFLIFRNDLGLVVKNCRTYNLKVNSDIRICCDTLREAAFVLYKQWFSLQTKKYQDYQVQL